VKRDVVSVVIPKHFQAPNTIKDGEMAEDCKRINSEGLGSFFSPNAVWGINSSGLRWVGETGKMCEILVGKH
jgi:hypothetical protein